MFINYLILEKMDIWPILDALHKVISYIIIGLVILFFAVFLITSSPDDLGSNLIVAGLMLLGGCMAWVLGYNPNEERERKKRENINY